VKISTSVAIYQPELISIGDFSRVDDFCVLSGKISIGRNVHVAVHCNIAGGTEGVVMEDFSGLAYSCNIFSQSDDYSGHSLTNPTVPVEFKRELKAAVYLGRHVIVGTGSVVFPGVHVAEGCSIAALSLVNRSTDPWRVYGGVPAKPIAERSKELLVLEAKYLAITLQNEGQ
jgi:acetyltransferase-like isoleucine patch superfamily enzyme